MGEMNIRPFYGGAVFDEGRQELRLFGPTSQKIIRLWDNPSCLENRTTWKTFKHTRPDIDLGIADYDEPNPRGNFSPLARVSISSVPDLVTVMQAKEPDSYAIWSNQMAQRASARTVPEPVRKLISGRFSDRHYHALSLIARCPGAGELAELAPALFYCTASSWVFKKNSWPMRSIRELLRGRPRELAAWLGFPKTAFRIFTRIHTINMRLPSYLYLRDAMRDDALLRKLYFQPVITPLLVRVITDRLLAPHVSRNFLLECGAITAGKEDVRESINTLRDTLDMLAAEGRVEGVVFDGFAHLERVHDEVLAERRKREEIPYLPEIPPPPFPGTREPGVIDIEPLTTAEDIVDWNRGAMGNVCIESAYLPRVARGNGYLYKITFPEDACLYVEPFKGKYRNRQLRGPGNRRVMPETEKAVRWYLQLRNAWTEEI